MKKIAIISFTLLLTIGLYASEIEKAPKFKSFEIGQRYISSSTLDMKTMGTTLLFDYAWQLSGFNGGPAGYISVPLGYTFLYAGEGLKSGRILSYGWTVKHELKHRNTTIPFFGYGLLLNQLRLADTDGSTFGHQTRFDFGFLFNSDKKINPYVKVEYSYTRYPHMGESESDKLHAFELKAGFRF